jgi:Arc/MetJ-type ribon-helix-helix transcriptional regulator
MKQNIAITIDQQLLSFIDLQAQGNRSDYLNSSSRQEQQRTLKTEIITALQEDLQDPEYLAEIAGWDQLALDGIDA